MTDDDTLRSMEVENDLEALGNMPPELVRTEAKRMLRQLDQYEAAVKELNGETPKPGGPNRKDRRKYAKRLRLGQKNKS